MKILFILVIANRTLSDDRCGKPMYTGGLIIGGDRIHRGEWPFIAAIYNVQSSKFFCSGTLLTTQHVVSAAHCIHTKYESQILQPDELVVLLGKQNLGTSFERGSVQANVKQIFIHPGWQPQAEDFDADISMIMLCSKGLFSILLM